MIEAQALEPGELPQQQTGQPERLFKRHGRWRSERAKENELRMSLSKPT